MVRLGLGVGECTVERQAAHLELPRDGGHRLRFRAAESGLRGGQDVVDDGARATAELAFGRGGLQPVMGAVPDVLPFCLGE